MIKKYLQAIGIWCLMVPLAILNGWLRENVLAVFGKAALPISGIILSACILAAACLLIPKIQNCRSVDYIIFGILWFALTNLFDLGMLIIDGKNPLELLKAFDITTGNLWILVVLTTAVSPYLASQLKHNRQVSVQ